MKNPQLLFIAAGAGILAALFYGLKPPAEPPAAPTPAPAAASAPAAPAAPVPQAPAVTAVEYRVEKGQRVAGPEVISLQQGAELTLTVLSDRNDELHLHGYDLHQHLKAGEPATLVFKAEHAGRFELELHGSHLALGVLEVQPR